MASLETRNAQDPWIKWATLPSKQASFFVVLAATIAALSSIMMGSCVEGFLKALQSDTHLYWTPASLVNEECSASFLGATNRCILQLHAPSCLHSEPFVRRRCYSKVGTPAEFKLGSPEWSNARRLAGRSSFHGLILTVQSVNLNIGDQLLMAWLAVS